MGTVGMVQAGENFGGQYYLPYSAGVLQAYAKAHLPDYGRWKFLSPVYKREPLKDLVRKLAPADLVMFSSYIWNQCFSLELARRIKEVNPEVVILFGGPQVPEDPRLLKQFLLCHPQVDLACYGEGEVPFLEILRRFGNRDWNGVPSIARRLGDSILIAPTADRIHELDKIPSPYLEGIFDPLIASRPDELRQALLETNRGCPFRCSFCSWGSNSKRHVFTYSLERTFREIDWISRNRIEFVFCCDANFGLFPERDMEIVRKVAGNKERYGYPKAFSVQSTKNATSSIFRLNKVLDEAGLQKGVNLALQSTNNNSLKSIRRSNISNRTYDDLQRMFTSSGIATFSDIIIGLPEETYGSFTDGVAGIIERGQHNRIQFINLTILENSEMALPEYQQRHGLVVKECRLVSHHTRVDETPEVEEVQRLVVGTSSMPTEDWIRSKVFCWLTSLLHFDKLFQIPFLVLNGTAGVGFRRLMETFIAPAPRHLVLSSHRDLLEAKARSILQGEGDFIPSKEWLNLCWPADEYLFIKLFREGMLEEFYREAKETVIASLGPRLASVPEGLLEDAVRLNAALVRRPGPPVGGRIRLRYRLWEWYLERLQGNTSQPVEEESVYEINPEEQAWDGWDEWMRDVVWYGGKRGAYFYSCRPVTPSLGND